MALFDDTIPANTESVKSGAQRMREIKTLLNSTLGTIFSAAGTTIASCITNAMLAANAVTSAKILDGAVTNTKLGALAVDNGKIADNSITAAKIAADAVTTVKILNGNVTTAKIAVGGVATDRIADQAITKDKIAHRFAADVVQLPATAVAVFTSQAHALTERPTLVRWVYRFTSDDNSGVGNTGYVTDDEIDVDSDTITNGRHFTRWANASNIGISMPAGTALLIHNKATGAEQTLTDAQRAKIQLKAYAYVL